MVVGGCPRPSRGRGRNPGPGRPHIGMPHRVVKIAAPNIAISSPGLGSGFQRPRRHLRSIQWVNSWNIADQ